MTSHNRMYTFVMYARLGLCCDGGLYTPIEAAPE